MAKRKITQMLGCSRMGTMASSMRAVKKREIKEIEVGSSDSYGQTIVHVKGLDREVVLSLSSTTAMQVVKAILENQADVTLCADDEFRQLVKAKIEAAEEDARRMVKCVRDFHQTGVREEPGMPSVDTTEESHGG